MACGNHTCAGCGAQFQRSGRGNRRYCQISCRPAKKQPLYIGRADRPAPCEGCGHVAVLTKGVCTSCSKAQRLISAASFRRAYRGRGHLPPILRDGERAEATCEECALVFTYLRTTEYVSRGQSRRFCCRTCQKRNSDRNRTKQRRAQTRSVHTEMIDVTAVFERDAWRCGMCGKKALRAKRGTCHPLAPELDHIMPLSKGGEHTYANVQLACRKCNAAKGATPKGQIPLFATA